MNAVERTAKDRISLNGYKIVDRSEFPPHWSDEFIQELAHSPGWIRYYHGEGKDSPEATIIGMVEDWAIWHTELIKALDIILYHSDEADFQGAVNAIRKMMQFMGEDLDDILIFMRKTEGKWENPSLIKNLRQVEAVS